ncbi:MAG: cytochrome c3 family protein [Candidatus Aminicenantales bacterium]
MRKALILSAIALLGVLVTVALAGITNTDHDFSGKGWNTSGEICIVCHTPHNADTSVSAAPLWNHTLSTETYTVYSSSTLDATVGQPGDISKLCLSCHDGTVAVDSFGGSTGTTYVTGSALVGTNLSDDHPVGFTYDTTLANTDGGLQDPATTSSGLGGTITNDMLFSGQLECASCHDPHDNTNDPFLVKSNDGSALCLTCHDK